MKTTAMIARLCLGLIASPTDVGAACVYGDANFCLEWRASHGIDQKARDLQEHARLATQCKGNPGACKKLAALEKQIEARSQASNTEALMLQVKKASEEMAAMARRGE